MVDDRHGEWFYFDIEIVPEEEMSKGVLLNGCMQNLHRYVKNRRGKVALAFPEMKGSSAGSTIRLFFQHIDLAEKCLNEVNEYFFFRDYTKVSLMKVVSRGYQGPYIEYRRFRIPARKSDRKNTGLHDRRKEKAQSLPFFHISSQSTSERFILRVQAVEGNRFPGTFQPNGYGLASENNPAAVPNVLNDL